MTRERGEGEGRCFGTCNKSIDRGDDAVGNGERKLTNDKFEDARWLRSMSNESTSSRMHPGCIAATAATVCTHACMHACIRATITKCCLAKITSATGTTRTYATSVCSEARGEGGGATEKERKMRKRGSPREEAGRFVTMPSAMPFGRRATLAISRKVRGLPCELRRRRRDESPGTRYVRAFSSSSSSSFFPLCDNRVCIAKLREFPDEADTAYIPPSPLRQPRRHPHPQPRPRARYIDRIADTVAHLQFLRFHFIRSLMAQNARARARARSICGIYSACVIRARARLSNTIVVREKCRFARKYKKYNALANAPGQKKYIKGEQKMGIRRKPEDYRSAFQLVAGSRDDSGRVRGTSIHRNSLTVMRMMAYRRAFRVIRSSAARYSTIRVATNPTRCKVTSQRQTFPRESPLSWNNAAFGAFPADLPDFESPLLPPRNERLFTERDSNSA